MHDSVRPCARERQMKRHPGTAFDHVALRETRERSRNPKLDSDSQFDRTGEGAEKLRPRIGERIALERRHRDLANSIARAKNRRLREQTQVAPEDVI